MELMEHFEAKCEEMEIDKDLVIEYFKMNDIQPKSKAQMTKELKKFKLTLAVRDEATEEAVEIVEEIKYLGKCPTTGEKIFR